MRIDDPSAIRSIGRAQRRDTRRSSAASSFDSLLGTGESDEAAALDNLAPVATLDSLLSIQEVDPEEENRSQAKMRAEAMLDGLDRLRYALLAGEVPESLLDRIYASAVARKATVLDPALRDVLDDIELRAAVELAKLGRL